MSDTTSLRPISKVLVANRGEIALRIMRTLRSMGVSSVAVIPTWMPGCPSPDMPTKRSTSVRQGYLVFDRILDAARQTGADAIIGLWILGEPADFAEAVEAAGIAFIGPDSIRTMGDKLSAKEAVAQQQVPLSRVQTVK